MKKITKMQSRIISLWEKGDYKKSEIAEKVGCNSSHVTRTIKNWENREETLSQEELDGEVILRQDLQETNIQKLRDQRRILNKQLRTKRRYGTALEVYNKELIRLIEKYSLNVKTKFHKATKKVKTYGIIQLSDLHLNELITLDCNKFDFKIAGMRLAKFASEIKRVFAAFGIKEVLIGLTGDLLNSDRRLDEMLNMSTNRAKATILATLLIEQFILDMNDEYNLHVLSISGNESRVNKEYGSTDIMISYNYDWNIYHTLRLIFRDKKGVEFIDNNPSEDYVTIGGMNILFIHGNQFRSGAALSQQTQKLIGKYSSKGIKIDYVLSGHLHETRIGEFYARSSSLTGANAYSDSDLKLISKAAQNIHIITPDKSIHTMKIDLQNYDEKKGYDINKDLEAYNAKSADKRSYVKKLHI